MPKQASKITLASSKSKILARRLIHEKVKPELRQDALDFVNHTRDQHALTNLIERLKNK